MNNKTTANDGMVLRIETTINDLNTLSKPKVEGAISNLREHFCFSDYELNRFLDEESRKKGYELGIRGEIITHDEMRFLSKLHELKENGLDPETVNQEKSKFEECFKPSDEELTGQMINMLKNFIGLNKNCEVYEVS